MICFLGGWGEGLVGLWVSFLCLGWGESRGLIRRVEGKRKGELCCVQIKSMRVQVRASRHASCARYAHASRSMQRANAPPPPLDAK